MHRAYIPQHQTLMHQIFMRITQHCPLQVCNCIESSCFYLKNQCAFCSLILKMILFDIRSTFKRKCVLGPSVLSRLLCVLRVIWFWVEEQRNQLFRWRCQAQLCCYLHFLPQALCCSNSVMYWYTIYIARTFKCVYNLRP